MTNKLLKKYRYMFILITLIFFVLLRNNLSKITPNLNSIYYSIWSIYFLIGYFFVKKEKINIANKYWCILILWLIFKLFLMYFKVIKISSLDLLSDALIIYIMLDIIYNLIINFKSYREKEYLSYHDQLTGLYNRRFLNYKVKSNKFKLPITVIIADIDKLKTINDNYGHIKGDKIIKKAAEIIKTETRKKDLVIRFGGDEFVVILPEANKTIASKVCKRINKRCNLEGNHLLDITMGYAEKQSKNVDIKEVLIKADKDMYDKKTT